MEAALRHEEAQVEVLLEAKEDLSQALLEAEEELVALRAGVGLPAVAAPLRQLAHTLGVRPADGDDGASVSALGACLQDCRRAALDVTDGAVRAGSPSAAVETLEAEVAGAAADIAARLHIDVAPAGEGLGATIDVLHRVHDVLGGAELAAPSPSAPVRAPSAVYRERVQEISDSVRVLAHVVGVRVDAGRGWGCGPHTEGVAEDNGERLIPVLAALQQLRRAAACGAGGDASGAVSSAPLEIWRTLAAAGYARGRSPSDSDSPRLPVTRPFMELVNAVSLLAGSVGVPCGVGVPGEEGQEVASVRQLTDVVDRCARQATPDRAEKARLEAAYLAETERRREMMDQVEQLKVTADDLRTLLVQINQSASHTLIRSISLVDAVLPIHPSTTPAASDLTEAIDLLSDLQQYILSATEAFFGLSPPPNGSPGHHAAHHHHADFGATLAVYPPPLSTQSLSTAAPPKPRAKKKSAAKKASVKRKKPKRSAG
eukprot:TRINITY_DN2569_c0_g1_i1.p1 TRINITY_DN2569_c0_g1~~TRINITY_DN2569_c0_g1_i1.p1  ORF type:complete len:487 (+),score=178.94 TRINITY_DN2569_c0_g1_i1:274-1734(+)